MGLLSLRRLFRKPVSPQRKPDIQSTADNDAMRTAKQKVDRDLDKFKRIAEQQTHQEVERLKRIAEQAYLKIKQEDLRRQAEKAQQEAEEERERVRREAERAQQEAERQRERVRREAERAQQEAERTRRRKLRDFWMSLSGREFEQELATLYRQQGYEVQSTPISGDEGLDLIMRKNGEKTVVQCKSHKAPVGPAIVRELYGSMVATGADNAILACTGGFTKGVRDFAKGKPIELIAASELATMADRREDKVIREEQATSPTQISMQSANEDRVTREEQGTIQEVPRCPRCRREMRLLSDRYVKSWGCTGYPQCIGTRKG